MEDCLTLNEVIAIAQSVGLQLTDEDALRLSDRLKEQLAGFRVLKQVDTDGVRADGHLLPRTVKAKEVRDKEVRDKV